MTLRTRRRLPWMSSARASLSPCRTRFSSSRMYGLVNTGSLDVLTPQISTLFIRPGPPRAFGLLLSVLPEVHSDYSELCARRAEESRPRRGNKMVPRTDHALADTKGGGCA